jgi:hypothetical protein
MGAILLALTLAASPSTKLGVFVDGVDFASQTLLAAPVCPRLVVFPLPNIQAAQAATTQVATFRSACPGSFVVAQVGDAGMGPVDAVTANVFWQNSWLTLLNTLGLNNFEAVEGPPDPQGHPEAFWPAFAGLVRSLAKVPIVGSLATGTPSSSFCPTADAMVVALGVNWAWSYNAFSTGLTQNVATESSTTLGYRAIRNGCANLPGIPIYLTQAGRAAGSWTTADLSWLAWLDARLAEDGEVVGAALFEAGASDRSLAPIASQLAAFIQNPSVPDGGFPDAGTDAGQGGITGNGGNVVPGGPPGNYPKSGCASAGAGAGLALLALAAPLALKRRRGTSPRPTPAPK